eukprot:7362187-Ditylum_brightwellii.AAC.1
MSLHLSKEIGPQVSLLMFRGRKKSQAICLSQGANDYSRGQKLMQIMQKTPSLDNLGQLQMMGIPCEGPSYIYGDNQSVLANTTFPDFTLKNKSQSIAYHFVREGSARDEWQISYVNINENELGAL